MTDQAKITNYDSIDENYLAHNERPDSWNNLYERPAMLSQFPPFQGKNVLDLGCGSGFYTEYVLSQGGRVTAVDASQNLLDRLSQRLKSPGLRLVCADIAEPLSFLQSDSFDYVICSLVIHYIEKWESLLTELWRVMKRDGLLYISTHHPYLSLGPHFSKNIPYFETTQIEDNWGKPDRPFKVRYYTRSLTSTLQPIIASPFKIVSISEPQPDEKCRQISPQTYQKLNERPGFLFITLQK